MALAFRNLTAQGNASGAALTVTKPTGVIDGDIIEVVAYLETNTNSWASVGSGFTLLRTDSVSGDFRQDVYWKRASGEPASWAWTPTSTAWRTVTAVAYSGNTGTGTPVDVSNGASLLSPANNTQQTAPSVTTTVANDMLSYLNSNFNGTTCTGFSGAATTFRSSFGGQQVGDAIIATATATGTTFPTGGTVSGDPYAAVHLALFLASSGAAGSDIPMPLSGLRLNTLIRM